MNRYCEQLEYSQISVKRLMQKRTFGEGFRDVRAKRPFRYDWYINVNDMFAYERGRQFALNYIGELKSGKRISPTAEAVMCDLIRARVIS